VHKYGQGAGKLAGMDGRSKSKKGSVIMTRAAKQDLKKYKIKMTRWTEGSVRFLEQRTIGQRDTWKLQTDNGALKALGRSQKQEHGCSERGPISRQ